MSLMYTFKSYTLILLNCSLYFMDFVYFLKQINLKFENLCLLIDYFFKNLNKKCD